MHRSAVFATITLAGAVVHADPPRLSPVARGKGLKLVAGRDRVAITGSADRWVVADGLRDDPAARRGLARAIAKQFPDTGAELAWGRTPVAFVDKSFVRPGGSVLHALPGNVVQVVQLDSRHELWSYEVKTHTAVAIVDDADRVKPLPPLPRIGAGVPGMSMPELCDQPSISHLATAPAGGVALVMECAIETDVRLLTVAASGTVSTRRLHALGHDIEPWNLVVASNNTPVIIGQHDGNLAYARAAADGSWQVSVTKIHAAATQSAAIAHDDAPWAVVIDDKRRLVRGDAVLELRTPGGAPLVPSSIAIDAKLGVVVLAYETGEDAPMWVLAEHPPPGPVRDL